MGLSRHFRAVCFTYAALMASSSILAAYMLRSGNYVSAAAAFVLLVVLVIALIRYVECTNRSLSTFLTSLKFGDFTQSVPKGPEGKSFAELRRTFDDLASIFHDRVREQEDRLQYLATIIQHVGVGLLVFDSEGNVLLSNHHLQDLLNVPAPTTLSDLQRAHSGLVEHLIRMNPGDRVLVSVQVDDEVSQIALHSSGFRRDGKSLTLLSLQNISAELNEKELAAWQNLIRVLTHEVKNSLAPIASLATSVDQLLHSPEADASEDKSQKVAEALRIISKRSDGLLQFIDAYRDLTHLPRPKYKRVHVVDLFTRVERLAFERLPADSSILVTSIDPPELALTADPHLIEQALINLTFNAIDAVLGRKDARIHIEASIDDRGRPTLRVKDNGPGIAPEALEKVFIPFFTTKKDGSGIGLSLSRQIMRMHGGTLTVHSEPDSETSFIMRF